MYVTCYLAAFPKRPTGALPVLKCGPSADDPSGVTVLNRCSRKRSGSSPAIGYACSGDGSMPSPGGTYTSLCNSYDSVIYDAKGPKEFSHLRGDWAVYCYRSNYWEQGQGYIDHWRVYFFVDMSGADCQVIGNGRQNNPYHVSVPTGVIKFGTSASKGDLPYTDSIMEWGKAEWLDYYYNNKHTAGPTLSENFGGSVLVDGKYYSYPAYAAIYGLVPDPKPSVSAFNEQFLGGHVIFADTSPDLGVSSLSNLIQEAKMKAIESIPVDRVNWIEKCISLVSIICGSVGEIAETVAKKSTRKVSDLASNGWLSYRYVYSTEKMDISEVREATRHLTHLLLSQKETFTCNGNASLGNVSVHVSLTFSTSSLIGLLDPLSKLSRMWKYDLWDLVPFSFIADWFTGFGDYLYAVADNDLLLSMHPVDAWYSVRYSKTDPSRDETGFYFRDQLSDAMLTRAPEYFEYSSPSASATVITKRSVDVVALSFGLL